jgi:hypothetical protein
MVTVIYDANVLYPMSLRDLLVRIGQTYLVRARWTEEIMEEWSRALVARRPDLETRIQETVWLMNEAIRDVLVTGYTALIPNLPLPDPDDRHVLAAAIRAGAQTIVTFNLAHFPRRALERYGMEALHPDELVADLIDLNRRILTNVLMAMAAEKQRPPMTAQEVAASLARAGLPRSARMLSDLAALRARSFGPPRAAAGSPPR